MAAIADSCRASLAAVKASPRDIAAVACSAPGPLDHREGIVHEAPNVVGFIEYPLRRRLADALGLSEICVPELALSELGTEQQRSMLERLGCRIGQGHLFGRPMKPSELEDWLVSSRQAPVMILPFDDHAVYQPA